MGDAILTLLRRGFLRGEAAATEVEGPSALRVTVVAMAHGGGQAATASQVNTAGRPAMNTLRGGPQRETS